VGNYSEYGVTIEQTLANYDTYYGLPTCTQANGCLQVVNQTGSSSPLPPSYGWDTEIALDVETAHMVCQTCKILLVEANGDGNSDLSASVAEAAKFDPIAISNSYIGAEFNDATDDPAYDQPGIAVIASTGDSESNIVEDWPSGLPYVIGAAGTTLTLNTDNTRASETVWSDSGGGCTTPWTDDGSTYSGYLAPTWQTSLSNWATAGCGQYKAYGDLSADANPETGEAINIAASGGVSSEWVQAGGTSLSAPLIAGMFGLIGKVPSGVTAASIPYSSNTSSNFYDVTSGNDCNSSNGSPQCTAGIGFDEPSGLGTPIGIGGFNPPPTQPTGLSDNVVGTDEINLNWTASTDNLSVTGYDIFRNGSQVGTTISTSYQDLGLSPGNYTYYVKAYDSVGDVSAASSTITASTYPLPSTPNGLSTTSITSDSLGLSWTASTDSGGPGLAGYYLYRYVTSSGAGTATKIASPSASATTYPDTGLTPGVSYSYYLEAYDTNTPVDVSTASSTLTVSTSILPVPTDLQNITNGVLSTSISLTWKAPTDNDSTITGYNLYRNGSLIASTKTITTRYTDVCLAPGTTYTYKMASFNNDGIISTMTSPFTTKTESLTLEGDIDGDGYVTGHDLSILLAHFGTNYLPAEFDCTNSSSNNIVEGHDLSILLSHYGN
jgi:hypothetical protein